MNPPAPVAIKAHIFLLQLGGPSDLDGITPFLHNLFADVLPGPAWFRALMGRFIAWRRTPVVRPLYAAIGGGSPLLRNTQAQGDALAQTLAARQMPVRVHIAMRYAPPRLDAALAAARADGPEAPWLALPLYPHFSYATTRSSLCEASPAITDAERAQLRSVHAYPTHPGYIEACSDVLHQALARLDDVPAQDVHVVFSAHGLPLKLVREGDPYPEQVRATVAALVARLPKPHPWTLSYQSRVGPVKWLTPSTSQTLKNLGRAGTSHVLVVPISFVSEHIETLYELDVELRDEALHAGVQHYHRVPTVGVHPAFIGALANLVQEALGAPAPGYAPGACLCDPARAKMACRCA